MLRGLSKEKVLIAMLQRKTLDRIVCPLFAYDAFSIHPSFKRHLTFSPNYPIPPLAINSSRPWINFNIGLNDHFHCSLGIDGALNGSGKNT